MAADDRRLRISLFRILNIKFDIEDLRNLCFLMDVDYDSLRGEGKAAKSRELIAQTDRRGALAELVRAGKELRADIDWPEVPVPAPAAAQPDSLSGPARAAIRLTFEPEMVRIPAGEFVMGSDPGKNKYAVDDEQPQHILTLPEFLIARTPVTNAQYLPFVQATGRDAPQQWEEGRPPDAKREHPVVYVSWHDARAYCDWLSKVTGRLYRLPSEAEWEKGARSTDGRIYPWGDEWDAACCNSAEGGVGDTTSVGAYPQGASPCGLLDMAGNVWEWTRSLWGRYPYDPDDGREEMEAGGDRVVRGGSFYLNWHLVRCAVRWDAPDNDWDNLGFRVCVVAQ